jgi:hypothetical protein
VLFAVEGGRVSSNSSTARFAYLTIINWHSRRVLSSRLSNAMVTNLRLEALQEASDLEKTPDFNAGQGSQFTSGAFTGRPHRRASPSAWMVATGCTAKDQVRPVRQIDQCLVARELKVPPSNRLSHGRKRIAIDVYRMRSRSRSYGLHMSYVQCDITMALACMSKRVTVPHP